jgi:hypothetical protein
MNKNIDKEGLIFLIILFVFGIAFLSIFLIAGYLESNHTETMAKIKNCPQAQRIKSETE